ncbi:MAG: response regulator [Opitutaceae bacterium]|nr:response regulator [Opitutaceae bacterium]
MNRSLTTASIPVPPMRTTPSSTDVWRLAPAHILVVDDDQAVRDLASAILVRAGFRISTAADGEAGWQAILSESFDLVLTDNEMPRLRGVDLIVRLRKAGFMLPVILVSGGVLDEEGGLGAIIGCGTVMAKPFSGPELVQRIRQFVPVAQAGAMA